jgi:hypothetical protein
MVECLFVNQVGIGSNPMGHPPTLGERISVLSLWVRRLTGGFRSCKAAVRVRFPPNPPTTSAARGHAWIAQLVERHVEDVGVGGSSPSPGTAVRLRSDGKRKIVRFVLVAQRIEHLPPKQGAARSTRAENADRNMWSFMPMWRNQENAPSRGGGGP